MTARVYTVAEAAALLRVSTGRCYELVRSGVIPALHLGRQVRIPVQAFESWLNSERAAV
jgi:excisionase family DNA binding protein